MKILNRNYFSKAEITLWVFSVAIITGVFLWFDRNNYITLIASLIGVTSLIYNAKGNPFGLVLMIVFSILYGIISFSFAYYGEMVTYIGMTMPMSAIALVSWLKNPYKEDRSEVAVNKISLKEIIFMLLIAVPVTVVFYFILKVFNTANLSLSTVSVTTSFIAVYLTFRRSPYYAIGYALNDIVLIVLWILASVENIAYISVTVCFVIFLVNDLYGFLCWRKMEKRQLNG